MPRQKIILIGARLDGHAGVVLDIIRDHALFEPVGFLDDSPILQNTLVAGLPVLGRIGDFLKGVDFEGVYFICSGNNGFRENCYNLLKRRSLPLANIIHPSAIIPSSAQLGEGIFIGPGVILAHNVKVGDCALINTAATVDHDNLLEDFVNICPGCHTSGRVHLKRGAFLGTGSLVIPDIVIGEHAIVGAGAAVIRNVEDHTTVVGVPARPIALPSDLVGSVSTTGINTEKRRVIL